jgi:hypothetical protein
VTAPLTPPASTCCSELTRGVFVEDSFRPRRRCMARSGVLIKKHIGSGSGEARAASETGPGSGFVEPATPTRDDIGPPALRATPPVKGWPVPYPVTSDRARKPHRARCRSRRTIVDTAMAAQPIDPSRTASGTFRGRGTTRTRGLREEARRRQSEAWWRTMGGARHQAVRGAELTSDRRDQ